MNIAPNPQPRPAKNEKKKQNPNQLRTRPPPSTAFPLHFPTIWMPLAQNSPRTLLSSVHEEKSPKSKPQRKRARKEGFWGQVFSKESFSGSTIFHRSSNIRRFSAFFRARFLASPPGDLSLSPPRCHPCETSHALVGLEESREHTRERE